MCPKCGSLMMPKKVDGKSLFACSCGFEDHGSTKVSQKQDNKTKTADIVVIEKQIETLPICDDECPKCGNKGAYYDIRQTRAADEPPTKFMRCTKCNHNWRDYD